MAKPYRILFVCMGNICRSPAAEGVFQEMVEREGLAGRVELDSAGTIGYHEGNPADSRMRQTARQRGYDLQSISRKIRASDFEEFDLILAMDRDNLRNLRAEDPGHRAKVALFAEYCLGRAQDVPDPYYGGQQGFETVLDMLEEGCEALLKTLKAELD